MFQCCGFPFFFFCSTGCLVTCICWPERLPGNVYSEGLARRKTNTSFTCLCYRLGKVQIRIRWEGGDLVGVQLRSMGIQTPGFSQSGFLFQPLAHFPTMQIKKYPEGTWVLQAVNKALKYIQMRYFVETFNWKFPAEKETAASHFFWNPLHGVYLLKRPRSMLTPRVETALISSFAPCPLQCLWSWGRVLLCSWEPTQTGCSSAVSQGCSCSTALTGRPTCRARCASECK